MSYILDELKQCRFLKVKFHWPSQKIENDAVSINLTSDSYFQEFKPFLDSSNNSGYNYKMSNNSW